MLPGKVVGFSKMETIVGEIPVKLELSRKRVGLYTFDMESHGTSRNHNLNLHSSLEEYTRGFLVLPVSILSKYDSDCSLLDSGVDSVNRH